MFVRLSTTWLLLYVILAGNVDVLAEEPAAKPVKDLILPGESFLVQDRPAFVMLPPESKRTKSQPWIMYAPTLPGFPDEHEKWMHEQFLAAGVAVAGIDVGEAYGSPKGQELFTALYAELVEKRGYAPKPCLLGRSRGGLWVTSWAGANPDKVGGIAGIYPVFDFRTYPGLANAAPAYGLKPEELEAKLAQYNPIERVAVLAQSKVPVYLIHGDEDKVVPLKENSAEFVARYKAAGAEELVTLNIATGQGHNYWQGFFRCQELVNFAVKQALGGKETKLIGRWPLGAKSDEKLDSKLAATAQDIKANVAGPGVSSATGFNGRSSRIEIADSPTLRLGTSDFTISLWVNSAAQSHESPGDLLSQYDPATRTGFHLGLYTHGGVTNSQSNLRQLHFGIDQGRIEKTFTDHGRLGQAVFVFALCVHEGHLYAATCEPGENQGHVYRFEGGDRWTDLGSPDKANAISAMATFDGQLYVASSKYRLAGSALEESTNSHSGGRVFRLGPKNEWISCGALSADTEAVASLISFRGKLYASSLYKPAGFFRYEGGERWTSLPTPSGRRVEATTVFNDALYATCYDEGSVARFDGEQWEDLGKLPGATQTYGFGVHRGELFVSEWPQAHVFRWSEPKREWIDTGKLGTELEAMPLVVYNGGLYCGTLPTAEVFRFDGPEKWSKIGRVDHTPDVKYRRAWSMAIYQGRLFVGTLPSGRVQSIEVGCNVTLDRALPTGWHHVAAVREANRLRLFVDGSPVATSAEFSSEDYDLTNGRPLLIGAGAQDHFEGALSDVRIYRGALSADQIKLLAKEPSSARE